MRRLSGLQWSIVLLTVATAIIHFVLAAGNWGNGLMPIMFALDGVGYILLIVLLYFSGRTGAGRSTIRWILILYTALTIILYFVFNGSDAFSSTLGLITKAIEALLIILLLLDRGSDFEEIPAATPVGTTVNATQARGTTAIGTDPNSPDWVGTAGRAATVGAAAAIVMAGDVEEEDTLMAGTYDTGSEDDGGTILLGAYDSDSDADEFATRSGVFEWEGFDESTLANLDGLSLDDLRSRLEIHLASIGRLDEFKRSVEYVEGIGKKRAATLQAASMPTALSLFARGMTRKGRRAVAQETGLPEKLILTWVNHIDLYRINGVGEEYADLLEQSGVDTVVELAQRNPVNLYQKMVETNEERALVRRLPGEAAVINWVEQATGLPRLIHY